MIVRPILLIPFGVVLRGYHFVGGGQVMGLFEPGRQRRALVQSAESPMAKKHDTQEEKDRKSQSYSRERFSNGKGVLHGA